MSVLTQTHWTVHLKSESRVNYTNKTVIMTLFHSFYYPLCIPVESTNRTGSEESQKNDQGKKAERVKVTGPAFGRSGQGPWSHLTCVNGTRVVVSEGTAFVVTAQGGTCLLAVGTFLKRKKCGTSASQNPPLSSRPSLSPGRHTPARLCGYRSAVGGWAGPLRTATH